MNFQANKKLSREPKGFRNSNHFIFGCEGANTMTKEVFRVRGLIWGHTHCKVTTLDGVCDGGVVDMHMTSRVELGG